MYLSTLSLISTLDGVVGHPLAPAVLTRVRDPVLIIQKVGCAPWPVWRGCGKYRPHRILNLGPFSKSLHRQNYQKL
jgi:hypothetical protein